MNKLKFLNLEILKYNNVFMRLPIIRRFTTSATVSNSVYVPEMMTHSYMKNYNEWLILVNYLKYLVKHPRECKFDRCVNILINIGDRILQYNKKTNLFKDDTTKWEWNRGILRQVGNNMNTHQVTEDFNPSSLLNLVRILSNLRLYHIINNHKISKKNVSSDEAIPENKVKSHELFNDIIDDIDPKSFKLNSGVLKVNGLKGGKIGPLRYDTNELIGYPKILTNPFCFELTDLNLLREFEKIDSNLTKGSKSIQNKFTYFINSVMAQFLDQLLILISNTNFTESKLCILSMYLSVMVYGPKLRNGSVCKIDYRVERSLYRIFDHICRAVRLSGNELSFRSLAYLTNSCKHRSGLMKFVASKLINHTGTIEEQYLENFCFSFSSCYYEDDILYNKLGSMINQQASSLSPVVTANIIFSFFRVGKLDLVRQRLFERLLATTG